MQQDLIQMRLRISVGRMRQQSCRNGFLQIKKLGFCWSSYFITCCAISRKVKEAFPTCWTGSRGRTDAHWGRELHPGGDISFANAVNYSWLWSRVEMLKGPETSTQPNDDLMSVGKDSADLFLFTSIKRSLWHNDHKEWRPRRCTRKECVLRAKSKSVLSSTERSLFFRKRKKWDAAAGMKMKMVNGDLSVFWLCSLTWSPLLTDHISEF